MMQHILKECEYLKYDDELKNEKQNKDQNNLFKANDLNSMQLKLISSDENGGKNAFKAI